LKMFSLVGIWVCLLVMAVPASGLTLRDAGTMVVEEVELSLLGGTVGWGAGAYWPLVKNSEVKVTVGPFLAFGQEVVGGGLGVRLPVSIPVPVVSWIDFVGAGGVYEWKKDDWSWEFWVGITIPGR